MHCRRWSSSVGFIPRHASMVTSQAVCARWRRHRDGEGNGWFRVSFPEICPEPVLANRRFSCENCSRTQTQPFLFCFRDSVHGLAWASDSVHLATVCDDTLYVWDAIKGQIKQQIGLPGGGVTRLSSVNFLSDEWLAHGATDGDFRITLVRVPCLCPRKERDAAEIQPPGAFRFPTNQSIHLG